MGGHCGDWRAMTYAGGAAGVCGSTRGHVGGAMFGGSASGSGDVGRGRVVGGVGATTSG
jgi:hypothetical protein